MDIRSSSTSELALILAGPLVWVAHFFLMYGAETLICAGPDAASRGQQLLPVTIVLTVLATAGLACILVRCLASRRQTPDATESTPGMLFWRDAPTALAALALLGVLWVAFPTIVLAACEPPAP